jgi:ubiquinone/menaquinone biosynthesis C-methylase UbiE
MKNKKNFKKLKFRIGYLIKLSISKTKSHPFIIVIAMHELFRNLYHYDPYINAKPSYGYNRINEVVENLINFINYSCKISSYKQNFSHTNFDTQDLFGKLWVERFKEKKLNSTAVLAELLKRLKLNKNFIKNKKILDIGCGSGRFTNAFGKLGAKLSVGVDLGSEGLRLAKLFAKDNNIKNTKFYKSNVLKLPFKSNTFDFVFCKGVLHHTGDTYVGLLELKRVLKTGSKAFIYLYGQGGLFWSTRKLMRKVMKKIPHDYTIKTLNLIGMPARRTIFVDSWYVPIEDHINKRKLESWFKKNNFSFTKYTNAKKTELEYLESKEKDFKDVYGNGELRYLITKL